MNIYRNPGVSIVAQGCQTISSTRNLKDLYGILRGLFLKQNMGKMLVFFFEINVKFPRLLHFVVLAAVNGDFEGFAFGVYSQVIFPYKSFKFQTA